MKISNIVSNFEFPDLANKNTGAQVNLNLDECSF